MFLDTCGLADGEIYLELVGTKGPDTRPGWAPSYSFKIRRVSDDAELGECDFRVGNTEKLFFGGNIGYNVRPEHRGNHYAGKACRILIGFARRHGMEYLYITCNPDNIPSRKTCEYAGGRLMCAINLPTDNDMYIEGERQKCLYLFDLISQAR